MMPGHGHDDGNVQVPARLHVCASCGGGATSTTAMPRLCWPHVRCNAVDGHVRTGRATNAEHVHVASSLKC